MACSSTSFTQENLRATADQVTATAEQIQLLKDFLREGEQSYQTTGIHEKISDAFNLRRGTWLAFEQLLVLLWLSEIRPEGHRIGPSNVIDFIWHHFILFTRDYERFCTSTVGHMIHHEPFTSKNRDHFMSMAIWPTSLEALKAFVGSAARIDDYYWKDAFPGGMGNCGGCMADCG